MNSEEIILERKPYVSPEITLELDLETRAGSILPAGIDPLDLTGAGESTAP